MDPIELTAAEVRSAGEAAVRRWFGIAARDEFVSFERELRRLLERMTYRAVLAFLTRCARWMNAGPVTDDDREYWAAVDSIVAAGERFAAGEGSAIDEDALAVIGVGLLGNSGAAWCVSNVADGLAGFDKAVGLAIDSAMIVRGHVGARVVWRDAEAAFRASLGPSGLPGEPVRPDAFGPLNYDG